MRTKKSQYHKVLKESYVVNRALSPFCRWQMEKTTSSEELIAHMKLFNSIHKKRAETQKKKSTLFCYDQYTTTGRMMQQTLQGGPIHLQTY